MRRIEIIRGDATRIEELENLVNKNIEEKDATLIDVTTSKHYIDGIKLDCLIYTLEYENDVTDWARLFNYVSYQQFEYKDMLKAFFMLNDPERSQSEIDKLVEAVSKDDDDIVDLIKKAKGI